MAKRIGKNKNKEVVFNLSDFEVVGYNDVLSSMDFGEDGAYENVDEVDSELASQDVISDNTYQLTAKMIVNASIEQLNTQNTTKNDIRRALLNAFLWLLFLQLLLITVLVVLSSWLPSFVVDKSVLISIITSVFVETLGVIAIMVKYAFDSTQEVKIIDILHSYISNFKIFNSSEHQSKGQDNNSKSRE